MNTHVTVEDLVRLLADRYAWQGSAASLATALDLDIKPQAMGRQLRELEPELVKHQIWVTRTDQWVDGHTQRVIRITTVRTHAFSEWQTGAACKGRSDWWLSDGDEQEKVQICLSFCPVLEDCRSWAGRYPWSGTVIGGFAFAPAGTKQRRPEWARSVRKR